MKHKLHHKTFKKLSYLDAYQLRPWEILVPCVKMTIKVRDIHEHVCVIFFLKTENLLIFPIWTRHSRWRNNWYKERPPEEGQLRRLKKPQPLTMAHLKTNLNNSKKRLKLYCDSRGYTPEKKNFKPQSYPR